VSVGNQNAIGGVGRRNEYDKQKDGNELGCLRPQRERVASMKSQRVRKITQGLGARSSPHAVKAFSRSVREYRVCEDLRARVFVGRFEKEKLCIGLVQCWPLRCRCEALVLGMVCYHAFQAGDFGETL
jgi:hypothetical protein